MHVYHEQAVTGRVVSTGTRDSLGPVLLRASSPLGVRYETEGWRIDYVNNNPGAFREAYFDFAGIRVYE